MFLGQLVFNLKVTRLAELECISPCVYFNTAEFSIVSQVQRKLIIIKCAMKLNPTSQKTYMHELVATQLKAQKFIVDGAFLCAVYRFMCTYLTQEVANTHVQQFQNEGQRETKTIQSEQPTLSSPSLHSPCSG